MANRLTTAYKSVSTPVKAAVWLTVCNFLQKGIAMLSMPIFTRLLSMEEYGQLTVYQSWHTILFIFATLNLSGAVINSGMVKYEDKRAEFVSSVQGLATTVTLIFLAVYLLFQEFWNKILGLSTPLMLIMFAQFFAEPAYLIWLQRNRFEFRYKQAVLLTVFIAGASPILGVSMVLLARNRALARVFAYAIVQVCVGTAVYVLQGIHGKKLFVKEYWKFALLFNFPLVPHYLSQHVLGQADKIMISRLLGSEEAAIYGVANTIGSAVSLLVNAINSSFVPTMYQHMKRGEYAAVRKSGNQLCLLMMAAVCAIMLAAPLMIVILAGKSYLAAAVVIPPAAASIFFTFIYNLFINVEFYFETTKHTMSVSVIGAILNIVLNYIMIPVFGYIAAAYTTLTCYILFAIGHCLLSEMLCRKHQIPEQIFDRKAILLISCGVLIFCILCALI